MYSWPALRTHASAIADLPSPIPITQQRSAISLAIAPELLAEPQGGKYRFIQAIEPDWIEAIISEMSSQTERDQVIDAIDRLVFVARMDAGLAELDASDSSPESACQNPSQTLPPLSPTLR